MQKKFISKVIASLLVFAITIGYLPITSVFAAGMTYTPQNFGLTLTQTSNADGKVNYDLNWDPVTFKYNDDSSVPTTRYYLARRKVNPNNASDTTGEYKWELRGNYTDEGVKVLNVYPDKGDGLKSWINNISNSSEANGFDVNITVDKQSLSDFNKNPEKYLKKQADGSYNYDVVVFGFWDSNNHIDLSTKNGSTGISSYTQMENFVKAGYGVIFGHDTIQMKDNSRNPNFTKLMTNKSSFTVVPKDETGWHYSEKIAVKQQGALTTYPFDIYGKSLIVPMTHNVNQLATDTSTVYMTFEKNYYPSSGDGPYYNYNVRGAKDTVMYDNVTKKYVSDFDVADTTRYLPANSYLMKDDNIAFIQCGHSSGKTSTTEQMILANTIYSLKQMIVGNKAKDQVLDSAKPDAPNVDVANTNELTFSADDNGSIYKYRVIAAPVGLSIYEQWDNIKGLLDDESVYDYTYPNEKKIAFSKMANTGEVKAGVKTAKAYEYYVDKKATGEKRDGEFLDISENYVLPELSSITKDSYLHIWTYDNANNVSFERTKEDGEYTTSNGIKYTVYNGITNINLWDIYPRVDATVKYEDLLGTAVLDASGKSEYVTSEMLGSIFTPKIPNISDYRYTESKPSTSLEVTSGADNTVTHVYDEILSKDIKVVIHGIGAPQVLNYRTVSGVATDKFTIDLPDSYNNYDYDGYYTVGDSTINDTTGTTYALGDELAITDNEPLYVHYSPKTKNFNVIVKDIDNDITYATIPVNGYVGHTTVVLSSLIKDEVEKVQAGKGSLTKAQATAYQNYTVLSENFAIDVTETTGDQVIELIPRTKVVLYLGYDFSGVTASATSGSAIQLSNRLTPRDGAKILDTKLMKFNGVDFKEEIPTEFEGYTSDWNFYRSTAEFDGTNYLVDYTNKVNVVGMFYYKGILPKHAYTIEATYKNIVGGLMPEIGKVTDNPLVINTSIDDPALVPMQEYHDVVAFGGVPAGTDFEIDSITVTTVDSNNLNPTKTYTYEATDNIYEFMPDMNADGTLIYDEYFVDINYRPYGEVTFNEYLCDTNNTDDYTRLNITKYKKLYEQSVKLYQTNLPYPYEVYKVVVDNVELTDEQLANFNFTTTIDKYSKNIDVYYRPLTYDLTVMARSNGVDNYVVYTYTDIATNVPTGFVAPTFNGYSFKGATAKEDTATVTTENDKVLFTSNDKEGNFTVYLDYNQNAEIDVTYIILDYDETGKPTEVHGTQKYIDGVYVGEEFTVSPLSSEEYELITAYTNGELYDLVEGEEYTFTVSSPLTKAYLVYIPKSRYAVNLVVNPTVGGEVFGNTTVVGDNLFFTGAKVTISATANPGYEFINWTTSDVTLDDASILATSFIMPEKAVTVTANFKKTGEDGGGDGGDGGGDIIPIDPVVPVNPPEIVFPERPLVPGDKGNITDLVEDPIGEIIREYMPYIQGYPEGNVQPSGSITRAEVMQVVYNLYGYGLYRDSYGDKSAVNAYSDVDYDDWYSDAIAFCVDYGVVNGYKDGTIRPDEPITRAELSAIIAKFVLSDNEYSSGLTDLDSTWAKDAIDKLYANGIVSGYPDGTFKPNQTTIRSEFTVMVNRLVDRAEEYHENITFPDLPKSHWAYDDMMNAANGGVVNIEEAQDVLDNLERSKNRK